MVFGISLVFRENPALSRYAYPEDILFFPEPGFHQSDIRFFAVYNPMCSFLHSTGIFWALLKQYSLLQDEGQYL